MATPDPPNSDALDQAIDTGFSALESGAAWLFGALAKVVTVTSGFIAHHWVLFTVITLVVLFHRKFMEWQTATLVIAEYTAKKRIAEARAEREARKVRMVQQRENAWLARADDRRFRTRLAGLEDRLKYHTGVRDILREKTFSGGRRAAALDAALEKHDEAILTLHKDINRLKLVWGHQRVLNLIDLMMHGADVDAKTALDELNKIWRKVDWKSFVPYDTMNDADKRRVIQLIEVMASNTQLGEARNAFDFVMKILDSYKWNWGDRQAA